jgi:hypothetical protein
VPLITTAAHRIEEVARRGSIQRSAVHLNLTPSAVNRHILALDVESFGLFGLSLGRRCLKA